MNLPSVPITAIVGIVAIIIIFKVFSKFSSKLLGFVLVVGGIVGFMYYKAWGPFKANVADITYLEEKYCGPEGDKDICNCIVGKIKEDITTRFSAEEIAGLKEKRGEAIYVLVNSKKATKNAAQICLGEENLAKYKTFEKDFIPINNEYLDFLGDKAKDVGNKVKEAFNALKDKKDDIDNKY